MSSFPDEGGCGACLAVLARQFQDRKLPRFRWDVLNVSNQDTLSRVFQISDSCGLTIG
jgi:hypothetical protein